MSGMATTLFHSLRDGPLLKPRTQANSASWAFLKNMVFHQILSPLDLKLAECVLKNDPHACEKVAAFICYLFASSRQGHLCVKIDDQGIFPDLKLIWNENTIDDRASENSASRLSPDDYDIMMAKMSMMIQKGAKLLSKDLVVKVSGELQKSFSAAASAVPAGSSLPRDASPLGSFLSQGYPLSPHSEVTAFSSAGTAATALISQMDNYFYFHRYWVYETSLLKHYQRISSEIPAISFDKEQVNIQIAALEKSKKLLPEQAKAILNACSQTLTIIAGGPGTGKTYTAGQLICILFDCLEESKKEKFEIVLAAPTGKAAANLQKSLEQASSQSLKLHALQSKTLHSLLGINRTEPMESQSLPLSADLLIIDESSMIDVRLMANLFSRVKPGARLILLGDAHQLPAVEAGGVFLDLARQADRQGTSIKLKTCLRAELAGILNFADSINQGNTKQAADLLNGQDGSQDGSVRRLLFTKSEMSIKESRQLLSAYAEPLYRCHLKNEDDSEVLLNHFNRFRILSPLRKGVFGVEEINSLILSTLRKSMAHDPLFIAPIIILKNDYRLDLFNGEVGVIICKNRHQHSHSNVFKDFAFTKGDYAIFPGKGESNKRVFPALLLPSFEYAYCLSVHKSQGSEFDHVLLMLPEGSEVFGREVLYTAATRARKKLELFTSDATLEKTIMRKNDRLSGILHRLQK